MKKTILLILCCLMMLTGSVYASAGVTIKSSTDNTLSLSGTSSDSGVVYVTVINPGYTLEDVSSNSALALQFYGKADIVDGRYAMDITLNEERAYNKDVSPQETLPLGGRYTFVVSDSASSEQFTFGYYYVSEKIKLLKKLSETADSELEEEMDELFIRFSLDTESVYLNTPAALIANAVSNLRGKDGRFTDNPDIFYTQLKDALYVAAFNNGTADLFSDGKINCNDMFFLTDISREDYIKNLSFEGIKSVNEAVIQKGFRTIEELSENFEASVALQLLINYKEMGYGHAEDAVLRYESIYKSAGIDVDTIKKSDRANQIYSEMVSSKAKSMEELYKVYKTEIQNKSSASSSGSSVGSLRGSSSGSSNGGYIAPEKKQESVSSPFPDLHNYQWAEEAVSALYRRGIISGRDSGLFSPSVYVTRAEFSKMMCLAFYGEPAEEECLFTDVEGWSLPYIAVCSKIGLINGITENLFMPDANITREQAATMVKRGIDLKNVSLPTEENRFEDDDSISPWASAGVYALKHANILSGRDGNMFCPKEPLTRAEAAKIVYKAISLTGGETFEK